MSQESHGPPRVVALIAAYNEADVLDAVIGDLVRQHIGVYVIDNRSTDSTLDVARAWLGRGLVGLETFPEADEPSEHYRWADLLRRKEDLAAALDADWFIHHDADEFRESPWAGCDLREAIAIVDRQGYNAIDFEVFHFRPIDDGFRPGDDVRDRLLHYQPAAEYDRLQIGCWKRLPGIRVDLASQAGHDVSFPGRRVFPIRFLLRHYPVRGQAHGERKIHGERIPRFLPEELAIGWHRQYAASGHDHLAQATRLTAYDPETARIGVQVENRIVEELRRRVAALEEQDRSRVELHAAATAALHDAQSARAAYAEEVERRGEALAAARLQLNELAVAQGRQTELLKEARHSLEMSNAALEAQAREREALLQSRTWRWSAPLRWLFDRFVDGREDPRR